MTGRADLRQAVLRLGPGVLVVATIAADTQRKATEIVRDVGRGLDPLDRHALADRMHLVVGLVDELQRVGRDGVGDHVALDRHAARLADRHGRLVASVEVEQAGRGAGDLAALDIGEDLEMDRMAVLDEVEVDPRPAR